MKSVCRISTILIALLVATSVAADDTLPEGYWDQARTQPLLDKTLRLRLTPDLSHLRPGEQAAVDKLLRAGALFQRLYERQRHAQSESSLLELQQLASKLGPRPDVENLLTLHRLFRGPIATTLENERLAFLPVAEVKPGKNVYPPDITPEELEAAAQTDPWLQHVRWVVRRTSDSQLSADLKRMARYPELGPLHPGLKERLTSLANGSDPAALYAVPYSLAYAPELHQIFDLLWGAANDVESEDADFAAFLRHRARDLLTDDYEAGDASWITGSFENLNAQIGSYETYDDELAGVKSFFSLSLLARDRARSEELAKAITGIQEIEDALPYDRAKKVRENIPVNVYNVIADFGQSRGTNTATILPNEAHLARKYGRTILLRYNIMTHPELFELSLDRYRAAVAPAFRDDLTLDANFQRTLWHEIGHYLGAATTVDGRNLDVALQHFSDLYEELKADLVSLFAAHHLHQRGLHSDQQLKAIYASGILRVLQAVRPRREQPYQTMQLMQWNYYLDQGVVRFGQDTGLLSIDYARYHGAVTSMLKQVLQIQSQGDVEAAGAFVEKWGDWEEALHGRTAANLRAALRYRYRLVHYDAID